MLLKESAVSDEVVRSIFESEFKDLKTKAFEYFMQIFKRTLQPRRSRKNRAHRPRPYRAVDAQAGRKGEADAGGAAEVKIEIVQLENIRSHVKSTVPFTRGFNCLLGGVGCGKSSVLYSIDFALFGDPIGRSYEYLLREGADCSKSHGPIHPERQHLRAHPWTTQARQKHKPRL